MFENRKRENALRQLTGYLESGEAVAADFNDGYLRSFKDSRHQDALIKLLQDRASTQPLAVAKWSVAALHLNLSNRNQQKLFEMIKNPEFLEQNLVEKIDAIQNFIQHRHDEGDMGGAAIAMLSVAEIFKSNRIDYPNEIVQAAGVLLQQPNVSPWTIDQIISVFEDAAKDAANVVVMQSSKSLVSAFYLNSRQQQRLTTLVLSGLESPEPTIRYRAAIGIGSIIGKEWQSPFRVTVLKSGPLLSNNTIKTLTHAFGEAVKDGRIEITKLPKDLRASFEELGRQVQDFQFLLRDVQPDVMAVVPL